MKTDDLIQLLATGTTPVDTRRIEQRLALAGMVGLVGAGGLMLALLGLNPRLGAAMQQAMFWGKLGFAAAVAVGGLAALRRLARPGAPLGLAAQGWAWPLWMLWALAGWTLLQAPPAERMSLVLGSTWDSCPFNIALLSVPAWLAGMWALGGGAPTRATWAGAAAGLWAGALAALVYALHCPEIDAPFLAVWYVLGIAIPTVAGALVGGRWLRW